MPLPTPASGENRAEFISRCVSDAAVQAESSNQDQALAICISQWENKMPATANEKLLAAIKARASRSEPFGYGITTADRYVKTLRECVGIEACNKYAATKHSSFDDLLRKAASTLVYSNPDMVCAEGGCFNKNNPRWSLDAEKIKQATGVDNIELPKNTLMAFKHVLTTPRKDRDGDVLRTQGAEVDPKMLLLWQHVHTLPIGKMVAVVEHDSSKLALVSVIVDMNELCHDAAVMIDNDMGRFSHGFRALEFSELKEQEGETTSPGGFDIKRFEIMEASLVSVPSNVDAEVEEVILGLVEGRKLTSPLMREVGREIRGRRNVSLPVNLDLKLTINGEPINEDKPRDRSPATKGAGEGQGCACSTSSKTDERSAEEAAKASDTKVEVPERYAAINFRVSEGMKEEARRGLAWREEHDRGGTQVGVARANQIINDGELTPDTWRRVKAYFDRHEVDKQGQGWSPGEDGYPSAGRIAWALWGGDAGKSRAVAVVRSMDSADDADKAVDEKMDCPECGAEKAMEMNDDGKMQCKDCGYEMPAKAVDTDIKAGRVLSRRNREMLIDVKDDLEELKGMDGMTRAGGAICDRCISKLATVIGDDAPDDEASAEPDRKQTTVNEAMAIVIACGTPEQRQRLIDSLKAVDDAERRADKVKRFRAALAQRSGAAVASD